MRLVYLWRTFLPPRAYRAGEFLRLRKISAKTVFNSGERITPAALPKNSSRFTSCWYS